MTDPPNPDPKLTSTWAEFTSPDSDFLSSILSDFTWNINASDHQFGSDLTPSSGLQVNLSSPSTSSSPAAAASASVAVTEVSTSNNPSVTSSSSDDPAENSTTSATKKPKKVQKEKKKAEKRIRQPRFAFMTKSDVDNLEDGYRWRKYGQKAVKNSPFPRSYFRCTNTRCTVKKRVERSSEDPTIVITTYEGQHCHQSIGYPRGGILTSHDPHSFTSQHHHHLSHPLPNPYYYQQLLHQLHRDNTTEYPVPVSNPSEEGLLGDVVPQTMRNP